MKLVPVILSGGAGTRLWPLSRERQPKQFHALFYGQQTMLQLTVERLRGLPDLSEPIVVCNTEHRFTTAEQLRAAGITKPHILLEPVGRNTAPAIAAAALYAQKTFGDDVQLLILSADHLIGDVVAFQTAIGAAREAASSGSLVVFGVRPTEPHTGYGYIHAPKGAGPQRVSKFVEKPDLKRAQDYVGSGEYDWNCGIFLFAVADVLAELRQSTPDVLKGAQASINHATHDLDFVRLDEAGFATCPNISIDYAVMEKIAGREDGKLVVVRLDLLWSDVGSWSSIWTHSSQDANGNAVVGDTILENTRNSYIRASDRLVAALGLEHLIIIDTPDALLVADKNRLDGLKTIVEKLKTAGRAEVKDHRKVCRPWGWYDVLDVGPGFKVKRIAVHPGGVLSLQSHNHRAEHWVVVRGVAEVTRGDEVTNLAANTSISIPVGVQHRLANRGTEILEIIEIQSGNYLEEDDIIRYGDQYGRA